MLSAITTNRPLDLRAFTADDQIGLPVLSGVAIHLLSLEKAEAALGELHALLSPLEQDQARAIASRGRRNAHIASRGLLRLALSARSGKMVRPEAWQFTTNAYGKLTLARANSRRLSFSLSYATSMLAIGVAENPQLGIDLEPIPDWTYADVTWDALTEREAAMLAALPTADRYHAFLRIWTLKEAYTKCLGVGVSLDFRDVEVAFDPLRVAARTHRAILSLHQHEIWAADRRFMLALAMRR